MTIDRNDDTPLERAYAQEENRRRKARAALLPVRQITPVLSQAQYKKWAKCFLTPDMGPSEIEPTVLYKDGNHIKFLLIPQAISEGAAFKALSALQAAKLNTSSRGANGQKYGKKLSLGWMKLRYPGYNNMRTAPTLEQPELLAALYPLLREMDQTMDRVIPDYHDYAWTCSMNAVQPDGEHDDLTRVPAGRGRRIVEAINDWTYTIRGTVFGALELNHNTLFRAHEDGHNAEGTCVCIAALGSFVGGRLVFPRYGYSAELTHGDLLICDNNHELHGNLGPIVGDRYSVVAFLHDSVLGRAPVTE